MSELTGEQRLAKAFEDFCFLIQSLREIKDEIGRSEKARHLAIAITETEKAFAFFKTFVLDDAN